MQRFILNTQNKNGQFLGKDCLIIKGEIVVFLHRTSIIKRFSMFCHFCCVFRNGFSFA